MVPFRVFKSHEKTGPEEVNPFSSQISQGRLMASFQTCLPTTPSSLRTAGNEAVSKVLHLIIYFISFRPLQFCPLSN
jgi:hypothetical protein